MMRLRVAFVLSLVVCVLTPLFAQMPDPEAEVRATETTAQVPFEETPSEASMPRPKLRLITQGTTENYIAKFNGTGAATESVLFESTSGFIGLGTITPANALHIKIVDGASNAPLKLETSGADSVSGLSIKNDTRNWLIRVDGTDGDKFKVFDANAAVYRMAIDDWGRVGFNTSDPKSALHVYGTNDTYAGFGPDPSGVNGSAMNVGYGGNSFGAGSGFINVRSHASLTGLNPSLRLMTGNTTRLMITNAGYLGVGTENPSQKLHVFSSENVGTIVQVENTSTESAAHAAFRTTSAVAATSYVAHGNREASLVRFGIPLAGWSENVNFNGNGHIIGTTLATPLVFGTATLERMRILGNGDVGIGTTTPAAKLHVAGNMIVTGNITGAKVIGAVYQDLAEWVPASSDMTPGTVVVLNVDKTNEVMPSMRRYDTTVAGVVSEAPGIILGVGGDTKEQIATTGRVKVRVDARNAPVRVGDLLVTSDMPGTAMRSDPIDINGHQFHKPGTIIGKALQPLEGGVAEILVLLSMQ